MLFPPQDAERAALVEQLHRTPESEGVARSRWTLALLQALSPALAGLASLSGVWRRLHTWHLSRQRSRDHLHSPDPAYQAKLRWISQAQTQAQTQPEVVLLYGDEVTCYRQPQPGSAYAPRGGGGRHQPCASRSCRANTKHRVVAVLDAVLGRVLFWSGSHVGVRELCRFLAQVRQAYGPTPRLLLVWDNWPVHYHEQVLLAASAARIELLYTPTYAPWCNPIEKLWRKLKQEVLTLHRHSDDWQHLKAQIGEFLSRYDRPSPDLLRYVGLALPN